jgi:hypothetical protein
LLLTDADEAGRENRGDFALPLLGLKVGRIGGIEQVAAHGHRHLFLRTMPTTTFALRPARRLATWADAARYRLHTRRVNRMVGELQLNSDEDKRIPCLRTNAAS